MSSMKAWSAPASWRSAQPTGPTYLSVSTETLMEPWTPPKHARAVPPAPQLLTPPEDIDRLARLLAQAKSPLVIAEAAGSDAGTYDALVALCELLALPVVESTRSSFANFPKDHPLHQGHDQKPFRADADLILVIRTRAPWYPPSDRPPNATIAVIDETPHRDSMVYQSLQADLYLEGNVGRTLRDLAAAAQALGPDAAAIAERRARLAIAHDLLWEGKRTALRRSPQQAADRSHLALRRAERGHAGGRNLYRRSHDPYQG